LHIHGNVLDLSESITPRQGIIQINTRIIRIAISYYFDVHNEVNLDDIRGIDEVDVCGVIGIFTNGFG
jgi:hypothetical protein